MLTTHTKDSAKTVLDMILHEICFKTKHKISHDYLISLLHKSIQRARPLPDMSVIQKLDDYLLMLEFKWQRHVSIAPLLCLGEIEGNIAVLVANKVASGKKRQTSF